MTKSISSSFLGKMTDRRLEAAEYFFWSQVSTSVLFKSYHLLVAGQRLGTTS